MNIPLILVGAGGMGRMWLKAIEDEPRAELAGVVDLDTTVAHAALETLGRSDVPVGTDAVTLAHQTGATAIVNVTVPKAHHPVATAALSAGLPVLGEKPAADTLPQALSLAAAAEATGQLFMVSQSRRYNNHLFALRDQAQHLGAPGTLATEFFKAPHFGGFREQMEHPLLVDMAIHPFDSARFILADEPVAVYCEEFNPPWSWYAGDAAACAIFEMASGARFTYTGSWCSPGQETSWNGEWRLSAEYGTATWDGEHSPVVGTEPAAHLDDVGDTPAPGSLSRSPGPGISGALVEFLDALQRAVSPNSPDTAPMGEVHQNIMSLAMVEAAIASAIRQERVQIDTILDHAWRQAVTEEKRHDVLSCLNSWPSVREALTGAGDQSPATPSG